MTGVESIVGLSDLWARTLGDPTVCVAVLDGPADFKHPCFAGAEVSQLENYWQRSARQPNSDFAVHATHVSSVIFGQHGSEVKGIAPRCRGINVPVALDVESVQCPLALTRGIDAARMAGANIIHAAPCIRSATHRGDDLLDRAVRLCVENNVLVVAPAGNDNGQSWCLPAALPNVLTIGALDKKGVPFRFSNWGGAYQKQGIVAPGEDILGAEPGGLTSRRKGTSCSAPVVTGVAALLMSLQAQHGEEPDSHRVREAILASALQCPAGEADVAGRCLAGRLNIPGAVKLLFDPRYTRFRQTSVTRSTRTPARIGVFKTSKRSP
jgi:cyanobactin maturation PatA/PatG family protease